MAFIVNKLEQE